MIDIVFSQPEGLSKSGTRKWNKEVKSIRFLGEAQKVIHINDTNFPDLNYRHFETHAAYYKFTNDRENWEYFLTFFKNLAHTSVLEIFYNFNDYGSVVDETAIGIFVKNLLTQIKEMHETILRCESEIEDLKSSVRSLEWDARS